MKSKSPRQDSSLFTMENRVKTDLLLDQPFYRSCVKCDHTSEKSDVKVKHTNITVAEKDDCDKYLANRINQQIVRKMCTNDQ